MAGEAALPGVGTDDLADRLAGAGLFVGLDFDGTLAPIAADPDEPTITSDNRRAVRRLVAHPDASVAVISGRGLSDLRPRVGVEGVTYAGNHGLELDRDGGPDVHPIAAERRPSIRRACDDLADRLADVPGCEIEDKGVTATVHYRRTPNSMVESVRSAVATVVERADDLEVVRGKCVLELRPDVEWDKGAAMDRLDEGVPDDWVTVYVGDDTTDEDAFRAVQPDGVGVSVGSAADTDAEYRLPSQSAVAPFLAWLHEAVLADVDADGIDGV